MARDIAARFPGLKPLLDEHIKDNEEILPHLFFGDVTRYAEALAEGGAASQHELQSILNFLDERFSDGDDQVQELLAVSFVELLPRHGEQGSQIRMLGPNLAAELDAQERWRPA